MNSLFIFSLLGSSAGFLCGMGCPTQCVAVPGNTGGAKDSDCDACQQDWQGWPCLTEGLCKCDVGEMQSDAPEVVTTNAPTVSKGEHCDSSCTTKCEAVPGNTGGVIDSVCAPCQQGQKYWPCNLDGLCQCAASGSQLDAPSPEVVANTASKGEHCDASCTTRCEAVPGHPLKDSACAPCQQGITYWPCNSAGLCQCAVVTTNATTASNGEHCDSSCTTKCEAVPGNTGGVIDSVCAPCQQGQTYWPCNLDGLCQCAASDAQTMNLRGGR